MHAAAWLVIHCILLWLDSKHDIVSRNDLLSSGKNNIRSSWKAVFASIVYAVVYFYRVTLC